MQNRGVRGTSYTKHMYCVAWLYFRQAIRENGRFCVLVDILSAHVIAFQLLDLLKATLLRHMPQSRS